MRSRKNLADAARCGDVEAVKDLLARGADPNGPETEEFWPPLHEAVVSNHVEAARLLLDAGADMYAPTEGGETPITIAGQFGKRKVFRLLVERGYRFDPERDRAWWLLPRAAAQGYLCVVEWLLSQGVPVDITDDSGCTALTGAAYGGHTRIMRLLLSHGADPNHRDNDTETVLMWAADHAGNAAALRLLLKAGADVNARNDMEGSALSWTMRHDDLEMMRLLLDAGADVNAPGILVRAVHNGFHDVVKLLLERGAHSKEWEQPPRSAGEG